MRVPHLVRIRCLRTLLPVFLLPAAHPDARAQDPPIPGSWGYRPDSRIGFIRQGPTGNVLVAAQHALASLDPVTGAVRWSRGEFGDLDSLELTSCEDWPHLIVRTKRSFTVIDAPTGETTWDHSSLPPFRELRGHICVPERDLLFLFAKTERVDAAVLALELTTGVLRWRADSLLARSPSFSSDGDVSRISQWEVWLLDAAPPPDSTLLFWVSKDGPMRLDWRTGDVLWQVDSLRGKSLPRFTGDFSADSTLFLPYDKKLLAVDVRTGAIRWQRDGNLPGRVTQMAVRSQGLLLRGEDRFMDLLDPQTGASRWAEPVRDLGGATDFVARGDAAYIVANARLHRVDLATGQRTEVTRIEFEGDEPASLMGLGTELLIASRQNIMLCAEDGVIHHHRHYKAPGAGLLSKIVGVATGDWSPFDVRYGRAEAGRDFMFFFTDAPAPSGREGISLVRVQTADGTEAGRIWFTDKKPTYVIDWAHDGAGVFIVEDGRAVLAVPFPD